MVKKELERERRARFARAGNIAKFWFDAAEEQNAFKFGHANNENLRLSKIIDAINTTDHEISYDYSGDTIVFTIDDVGGEFVIHDADSDTPYIKSIDAPNAPGEDLGSLLYQIAFSWAINNGKAIVGDPGGLTTINVLRRSFQMLSSGLRYGTIKHVKPSSGQLSAGLTWGKSDLQNISNLAEFISDRVLSINEDLAQLSYNLENSNFYNKDGEIVNDKEITAMARGSKESRSAGIGLATAKVALATRALRKTQSGLSRQQDGSLVESGIPKRPQRFHGRRLAENHSQILKSDKKGVVKGIYNPSTDTSYFIFDNISQDTGAKELTGLVAHEVAVHALKMGKSDGEFQALLKRFEQMRRFNPKVREAFNRVPKDTKPEHVTEETLAYFIENNPESSLGQRIIQAFRKLLRAIGNTLPFADRLKWVRWANNLGEGDIISMATSALRQAPDSLMFDDASGDNSIRLAKAKGYEGNDNGESVEWLRAVAKGLDMSKEARMERAKAMGFDVDTPYIHESPEPIINQIETRVPHTRGDEP